MNPCLELRHRIHDEIDSKLRVVARTEALVPAIVIPLTAIILIREDHAEPPMTLDAAKIAVDDVVPPAVQLVTRLRRSVELEERAIQRMTIRNLGQRGGAGERALHFGLERLRVET